MKQLFSVAIALGLLGIAPGHAGAACTTLDTLALADLPGSCDPEWSRDTAVCPNCFRPNFSYPTILPHEEDVPWADTDFTSDPDVWLRHVLDYALEGFDIPERARWDVFKNTARDWYHAPWMHPHDHNGTGQRFDFEPLDRPQVNPFKYGPVRTGREYLLGLTEELQSFPHFLGAAQSTERTNWAVSFFNPRAAHTLHQIWSDGQSSPVLSNHAEFAPGSVFVKPLYTTATPSEVPFLAGAPKVLANVSQNRFEVWNRRPTELLLIQFDVAVKYDAETFEKLTGLKDKLSWVYGTFVYDARLTARHPNDPWARLRPVGVTWGNDPGLKDCNAQDEPRESIVLLNASDLGIPLEARAADKTCAGNNPLPAAFGREGRMNGPVDGVNSSCMSCHGAAQFRLDLTAVDEDLSEELTRAPWPDNNAVRATLSDEELWLRDSCLFLNRGPGEPLGDFLSGTPDKCDQNADQYKMTDTSLQLAFALSRYCKFIISSYRNAGKNSSEDLARRAQICSPGSFNDDQGELSMTQRLEVHKSRINQALRRNELEIFMKGRPPRQPAVR